tara:strand:+ start:1648 stop:2838 length:1191 start_codon:yes stop_codon:yes gene_type:complete
MTRKGVWNLQDVRDKYLQSLWANDTSLFTWGSNGKGYLMRNNTDPGSSRSPHQVPGTTWIAASTGKDQLFAAVRDDGTLWMGGGNEKGTLGINEGNDDVRRSSPIQIPGTNWAGVKAARETVLANKSDGTLWGWGSNSNGILGQSNQTNYSSPVQIPGTTWTSEYSIGNAYCLAVKSDGTLWAWGVNNEGQLGLGNQTAYSSPKQIPGTTWSKVGASKISSVATRTDGTLWTWGESIDGSLGHNQSNNKESSPRQIPGTTWSDPACGYESMGCVKTDGTLWMWGNNGPTGQLGLGNKTNRSSPQQVLGTTWARLYGRYGNSPGDGAYLAVKTDGTMWSWGYNGDGVLGGGLAGDSDHRSSPIQIGTSTNWKIDRHAHSISQKTAVGIQQTLTPSQL